MSDSSFYQTLRETANKFVQSTSPATPNTNVVDRDRIISARTPDCMTYWGPTYFTIARPGFQKPKDDNAFVQHMESMTPEMETWSIGIKHLVADEKERTAAAFTEHYVTVKGPGSKESRTVQNDVIWFMKMTQGGKLVAQATEYVDGGASATLGEKMKASMEEQDGQ